MDTIRNYVDMMFKDLPKTKEVVDMKLNILDNMEDRYNELLAEGKTENEAIGAVISQFGNIDELKEELGISSTPHHDGEETATIPFKSEEEVLAYLRFKNYFSYMIAIGVVLCILSVIPPIFSLMGDFDTILFFFMVACGVAVLIIAGMKNSEYTEFEKQPFQIRETLRENLQQKYQKIKNANTIGIAVGVMLCILAPMMYMLVENSLEWTFQSDFMTSTHITGNIIEGLASASLFICVAIAVFMFITLGIKKASYDLILQNEKTRTMRKAEEKDDQLYGIVMPLAAVIYLVMGFCFGWWHPGWIIFPLAAIVVSCFNYLKREGN